MNTPKRRRTDAPNSDLQDANTLLRTVIDENPNIILMKDWNGKFLLGNRALANLYGTTPEELVGKDDGDFNPNAEQVAFYLKNVREVMSEGQTRVVMEESTDTATGETFYYQSIKIPLTTPQGDKQILVIANDVSELKRVQLKLEESERRLSYVLDATGEGIWDWDIRTGVVTHNRRWCQIAGLNDEYLQHPLDEFAALLHADDKARVMAKLQDCLAGKARYQSEHRMRLKGQQEVWVLDRGDVVERDANGQPLRMVGSFVDISERKAAEALLSEHSAQLDAIFALSPDGFVAFNHRHLVKYVSPTFTTLTGLSATEVIGLDESAFSQRLEALCPPDAGFQGLAALRNTTPAAMGNEPHQVFELKESPGATVSGRRVLKVSLRESQEQSISQILSLRDISHETAVDRMKSEFLSTAAHELRTPMSSIYGFAEVLLTEQLGEAERKEFLEIIYRQSKLMASILNELLDLARIEALQGKDFVFETVPVQGLIEDVVRGLKLPDGRALPMLALPAQPVFLWADQKKTQMALLNVLSNAYKYSAPDKPVHLAVRTQPGEVILCVTDQGVGMSPEQAVRVGERFYRADSSGKVPGTGLGMSIVKEIMALHYGRVDIVSAPGQGTTVALVFPAGSATG
ncbi:PAS domain S-box protein [Rhodoferax sp.]|uniref:PAS domain-containing sensor histidine kinase n=1 Tax=Rhodoferax sp. TaxID=50421 RepID=UPI0026288465|nr:PAS domain S-box protein [Rhodoferax sp.]MDD3935604.1 PAS domain S-box protein [Rhodoferax sp.]